MKVCAHLCANLSSVSVYVDKREGYEEKLSLEEVAPIG